MRKGIWEILGIEPTTDKKAIKKAYATQSHRCHPEDNPEAFQELQQAYQMALSQTSQQPRQQAEYATHKQEISETKKTQAIDLNLDIVQEETQDHQLKKFENLEEIPQENTLYHQPNTELFNEDIMIDDFIDRQAFQDYMMNNIVQYLGNQLTAKKINYIVKNANIIGQLQDQDFKNRLEDMLLSMKLKIKVNEIKKVVKQLQSVHFDRIANKINKKTFNSRNFRNYLAILVLIVTISMNIFEPYRKKTNPSIEPYETIEQSQIELKKSINNNEYIFNQIYLNGMTISEENNMYILKDIHNKIVLDNIESVQYTRTAVLVLKINNQFYLFHTKDSKQQALDYKNVGVATVNENGKAQYEQKLVVSQDSKKWQLCDLNGKIIQDIKGTTSTVSHADVYIENNQASFK